MPINDKGIIAPIAQFNDLSPPRCISIIVAGLRLRKDKTIMRAVEAHRSPRPSDPVQAYFCRQSDVGPTMPMPPLARTAYPSTERFEFPRGVIQRPRAGTAQSS